MRAEILGLPVDDVTIEGSVSVVESWVDEGGTRIASGVNANVVNLAARDAVFGDLLRRNDLNYVDGQSMVWASRLFGLDVRERVATTDLVYPLTQMCARRGFSVYLLGGREDVVSEAARRLRERSPGLDVSFHHGYLGPGDGEVVAVIRDSGARVVLVGMGDPGQQEWVHAHASELPDVSLLTCGGLFDWVSGRNRRPPPWMARAGLEWLWRVIIEPRRLARRYLIGNPEFIVRLAAALARRRFARP